MRVLCDLNNSPLKQLHLPRPKHTGSGHLRVFVDVEADFSGSREQGEIIPRCRTPLHLTVSPEEPKKRNRSNASQKSARIAFGPGARLGRVEPYGNQTHNGNESGRGDQESETGKRHWAKLPANYCRSECQADWHRDRKRPPKTRLRWCGIGIDAFVINNWVLSESHVAPPFHARSFYDAFRRTAFTAGQYDSILSHGFGL